MHPDTHVENLSVSSAVSLRVKLQEKFIMCVEKGNDHPQMGIDWGSTSATHACTRRKERKEKNKKWMWLLNSRRRLFGSAPPIIGRTAQPNFSPWLAPERSACQATN